jgi:hypothetical protein
MDNYPLMKKDRTANEITFAWGSLPVDALNPQTMGELQMIARRKRQTIEQVMPEASDWVLAVPERSSRPTRNSSVSGFVRRDVCPTKNCKLDETFSDFFVLNY